MQAFEIFFHNNGSATFQTAEFVHCYDDMDQMAADFVEYQKTGNTSGWEGDEPEFREDYDSASENNGSYFCVTDLSWELNEEWGYNVLNFAEALRTAKYSA